LYFHLLPFFVLARNATNKQEFLNIEKDASTLLGIIR
jgi:hypothetical protein